MTPPDDVLSAGDPHDLSRFVRAQEGDYARALAELQSGQKRTHWMWYIFPHRGPMRRTCEGCGRKRKPSPRHPFQQ